MCNFAMINSIGYLCCWLSGVAVELSLISQKCELSGTVKVFLKIARQESFWGNKRNLEFSDLSSDSPYLQAVALKILNKHEGSPCSFSFRSCMISLLGVSFIWRLSSSLLAPYLHCTFIPLVYANKVVIYIYDWTRINTTKRKYWSCQPLPCPVLLKRDSL